MSECFHINLVKQVGSLDDSPAKSTRYQCSSLVVICAFLMVSCSAEPQRFYPHREITLPDTTHGDCEIVNCSWKESVFAGQEAMWQYRYSYPDSGRIVTLATIYLEGDGTYQVQITKYDGHVLIENYSTLKQAKIAVEKRYK